MSRRLPDSLVSRRALRWAMLAGVVAASFTAASLAFAGFNSPASGGPGTYASKRIFPGIRSSSAWTFATPREAGRDELGRHALLHGRPAQDDRELGDNLFGEPVRRVRLQQSSPRRSDGQLCAVQLSDGREPSATPPASISRSIAPRPRP